MKTKTIDYEYMTRVMSGCGALMTVLLPLQYKIQKTAELMKTLEKSVLSRSLDSPN